MNAFSDFIEEHWGKRIANAHNEYLQYLVTTGILGAVSYIMIYVSSFYDYIKKKHWCEEKGIWLFGIMGYAGQAVVNNPQALNMATLFLFLAIYRSFSYMQQMQEAADRQKARLETDLRHRDNEH